MNPPNITKRKTRINKRIKTDNVNNLITILDNSNNIINPQENLSENDLTIPKLVEKYDNNFSYFNFKIPEINNFQNYNLHLESDDPINFKLAELLQNEYNDWKLEENIIEEKNIDVDIENLDDLIKMIKDNPNIENVKYNIQMQHLYEIKPYLIELNNMIGVDNLKNNILDQILYFAQNLHINKKNNEQDFMHTVIYGPPGTGKTEISKILGKIYSKLGVLKNGTFKKATRSDLIAGYLGQTAIKTRDLINSCLGGVLFIDEAYSLGNSEKRDSFAKECIDTLCESLSEHKNNLMVIIAGYEDELNECFFNFNKGLDSRFIWRFKIDKYSPDELMKIFIKKVNDNGWKINEKDINVNWFEKNIDYFKYYGRDMETLFSKIKIAHGRRVFCKPDNQKTIITLIDMENGFKMFLNNEEVKHRKRNRDSEREISFSLYN